MPEDAKSVPHVPKKLRQQLEWIEDALASTQSPAERKKLLAKKRTLKARIAVRVPNYDPDYEPLRYKTWGRWSKAPGSVKFWRGH